MMSIINGVCRNRFIRFILVGGFSALVDVGLTYLLTLYFFSFYIPVTLGFMMGLLCNYYLHTVFTFSSNISISKQIPRFLTVVALNYSMTLLIVFVAVEYAGIATLTGKLISLPFVAATGFLLSKYWVYGSQETGGDYI